jgi:hypothetical protein
MLFVAASSNIDIFSGIHASTVYVLLAIALTGFSLYVAIKKNRQDSKDAIAEAITDKVVAESKQDIAEAVKAEVITAVRSEIANIDYKITRNGKNTNNLGDVAARTEEKVDLLNRTVEVLAMTVTVTNDKVTEHIGWHHGYEDSKKKK